MAEITYVEKQNFGKVGTDSNWFEVSEGHYNNYGDKIYISSKYKNKSGDEKTGKSLGLTKAELKELLPLLQKAVEE